MCVVLKKRKIWNVLAVIFLVAGIGFFSFGIYALVTGFGFPSDMDMTVFDPNDDISEPIYIKSYEESSELTTSESEIEQDDQASEIKDDSGNVSVDLTSESDDKTDVNIGGEATNNE